MRRTRFLYTVVFCTIYLVTTTILVSQQRVIQPVVSHTLGDQVLSINGGLSLPLFYQALDLSVHGTNLWPGGVGSLLWKSYLNDAITIGAEIGGMFSFSSQNFPNLLLMLPITVQGSYIFRAYPFEFPVFLGAGIDIVRYLELTHFDFILKPGFSAFWVYDSSWSFGFNCAYW